MDWRTLADDLMERMTMPELARRLGFEPNRGGFIICPFHDERTASLKVYDRQGFYCFGCGEGGDQIRFLRLYRHLGFKEAVAELASMAGTPIDQSRIVQRPAIFRERSAALRTVKARSIELVAEELDILYKEVVDIEEILARQPTSCDEIDNEFAHALHRKDYVRDSIERLEYERDKISH